MNWQSCLAEIPPLIDVSMLMMMLMNLTEFQSNRNNKYPQNYDETIYKCHKMAPVYSTEKNDNKLLINKEHYSLK